MYYEFELKRSKPKLLKRIGMEIDSIETFSGSSTYLCRKFDSDGGMFTYNGTEIRTCVPMNADGGLPDSLKILLEPKELAGMARWFSDFDLSSIEQLC